MRHLLCFSVAIALPQLAHAQLFKNVEIGSFVLSATPQLRQTAGLYLRNSEQLVVRDLAGKNTTFSPQQVRSFKIGQRQFVTTGGFKLSGEGYVTQAFAEQLDSGQVVLLRYQVLPNNAATRGNIGYDSEAGKSIYLLRSATASTVTPIQAGWSRKSAAFQEALRPYLASRPDLLQLLATKSLAPKQLPLVIHALNQNLPYGAEPKRPASN